MSEGLQKKTINSVFWSTIERFSTQAVSFVLGIFIARLLSPSDYGTIAMLNVFFAILGAFVDSGFSSALIRKIDRNESDYSTAFYFNIVVRATASNTQ
ncbi:MAG: oligosaccharide flippase family protein [Rikenellaceae bacterium]